MSRIKSRWMQMDQSYFYMVCVKREGWQLPEWECVGEVHLRQVYETIAPHYVAVTEDLARKEKSVLGHFPTLEAAQEVIEASVQ